ncbi:MAG: hypothetical protein JSW13_01720 [Candidatus Aerophobus sp.]|nr:MAG: hypothetical protein JSW13_01720 [Candidatus Aerophobus sp.]
MSIMNDKRKVIAGLRIIKGDLKNLKMCVHDLQMNELEQKDWDHLQSIEDDLERTLQNIEEF